MEYRRSGGVSCKELDPPDPFLHGLRARVNPTLVGAATDDLGSYSADRVNLELGRQSWAHCTATLPVLPNRAFTAVNGVSAWELPNVKVFS